MAKSHVLTLKQADTTNEVILEVAKERFAQLHKGHSPEHDDAQEPGHLKNISLGYIMSPVVIKTEREDLVKAAATLIARIEQLDRQANR